MLKAVASNGNTQVSYWYDANGDGVGGANGADDIEYFRLTLSQDDVINAPTADSAGSYTFTVINAPQPPKSFDFSDLPSGQNLFGMLESDGDGLVIISSNPVWDSEGQMTPASKTINTSKGGGDVTIGSNNQMIDPGEGVYFTLVTGPAQNYSSSNLDPNEADDVHNIEFDARKDHDAAFIDVVQVQGGKPATMLIKAFDFANPSLTQASDAASEAFATLGGGLGDPSATGVTLTKITVFKVNPDGTTTQVRAYEDAALLALNDGTNGYVVPDIRQDYRIQIETDGTDMFDQVYIEGKAGKFDIGGFGTLEAEPVPDLVLDFTAKITDGDGDTASASWSIGIDGTGAFDDDNVVIPAPLAPAPAPLLLENQMHVLGDEAQHDAAYILA